MLAIKTIENEFCFIDTVIIQSKHSMESYAPAPIVFNDWIACADFNLFCKFRKYGLKIHCRVTAQRHTQKLRNDF